LGGGEKKKTLSKKFCHSEKGWKKREKKAKFHLSPSALVRCRLPRRTERKGEGGGGKRIVKLTNYEETRGKKKGRRTNLYSIVIKYLGKPPDKVNEKKKGGRHF